MTANATEEGCDFASIPDVTVLYITEYDALKNGKVFTVSEMCQKTDDGYKPVCDGGKICYANTAVKDNSDKSELLQLFLEKKAFKSAKFPKLSERVNYLKNTEEGRDTMCEAVEAYTKKEIDARMRKVVIAFLKNGDDVDIIASATELSKEEVLEIKKQENL